MTESGTVISAEGGFASVRIMRRASCASCGGCGMADGEPYFDAECENPLGAMTGDAVTVAIPERSGLIAALLLFVLPVCLAALGLYLGSALLSSDGWALALCLVFLTAGYGAASFFDRALKRSRKITPKIIHVMRPSDSRVED